MSGWRFNEPPKDRPFIAALGNHPSEVEVARWAVDEQSGRAGWISADGAFLHYSVQAWQDLPAPPIHIRRAPASHMAAPHLQAAAGGSQSR